MRQIHHLSWKDEAKLKIAVYCRQVPQRVSCLETTTYCHHAVIKKINDGNLPTSNILGTRCVFVVGTFQRGVGYTPQVTPVNRKPGTQGKLSNRENVPTTRNRNTIIKP